LTGAVGRTRLDGSACSKFRVQREALRLFAAQGYDQITVEQITEAAETSTTTFGSGAYLGTVTTLAPADPVLQLPAGWPLAVPAASGGLAPYGGPPATESVRPSAEKTSNHP
jgi:Bacterial regulatory proteins, tetR family